MNKHKNKCSFIQCRSRQYHCSCLGLKKILMRLYYYHLIIIKNTQQSLNNQYQLLKNQDQNIHIIKANFLVIQQKSALTSNSTKCKMINITVILIYQHHLCQIEMHSFIVLAHSFAQKIGAQNLALGSITGGLQWLSRL